MITTEMNVDRVISTMFIQKYAPDNNTTQHIVLVHSGRRLSGHIYNKKAVLSQRRPRDARYISRS